jgi:sigma-B regulation protein RsbU (phosphoserine phosphatase)
MENYISLNSDLRKKILSTIQIQMDVFHYKKIHIIGLGDDGLCKLLLQSDKKSYDQFQLTPPHNIEKEKIILKNRLANNTDFYALCEHFDVQVLFPIKIEEKCFAILGINSQIQPFSKRQIEGASFISNYISNMVHNQNLVQNLENYSDRMQKMLNEMVTLHEITHALESSDNIDSLLEYIMQKSMTLMNSEAASLMLVVEETNELEFKIVLGPKATEVRPFRLPIGKGISGWVAQSGEAVLIPDTYADSRFDPSFDKRSGFRTRSMLCVPMIHNQKTVGVISIINRLDGLPFNENDKMLSTIFASQAALAIENARLLYAVIEKERLDKELQVASEIQNLLIPQFIPETKFLEIAAEFIPCKEIGGDFYDVIKLDQNKFIFVVADVSGKGIPGALVVSNMQATLRAFLQYSTDLIPIVSKLNESIIRQTTADRYITFFIGLYDHTHKTFTYINAGHNPPVHISQNGTMEELRTGGIIIGYVPWEYECDTVTFHEGDTLVMYTDGLVEAMNESEEEFGFKKLKEIISEHKSLATENLKSVIINKVNNHIGDIPLGDDFTLLILKRTE